MFREAILSIVVAGLLASAGCGADEPVVAEQSPPTDVPHFTITKAHATRDPERAYRQAHDACRPRQLRAMAKSYGVPADPVAVAGAVASGVRSAVASAAQQGCEDGFAGRTTAVQ